MAFCVCQCVNQKKFVCPFVGLHCGCVPPCENMCVRSLGYIVGASPPLWKYVCPFVGVYCGCVPPFVGSLHAAYSALRHFLKLCYILIVFFILTVLYFIIHIKFCIFIILHFKSRPYWKGYRSAEISFSPSSSSWQMTDITTEQVVATYNGSSWPVGLHTWQLGAGVCSRKAGKSSLMLSRYGGLSILLSLSPLI